jgi:hypothetical protein
VSHGDVELGATRAAASVELHSDGGLAVLQRQSVGASMTRGLLGVGDQRDSDRGGTIVERSAHIRISAGPYAPGPPAELPARANALFDRERRAEFNRSTAAMTAAPS